MFLQLRQYHHLFKELRHDKQALQLLLFGRCPFLHPETYIFIVPRIGSEIKPILEKKNKKTPLVRVKASAANTT